MEKVIASLIERVFGNWITTVIGVLVGIVGLVAGVAQVIPSTLVWHGYNVDAMLISISTILGAVALILAKDKGIKVELPKVGVILFVVGLGLMCAGPLRAQDAVAPSDGISATAGPVAIQYGGDWSAATLTRQLFDFKDGQKAGNNYHLYLGSYQLVAPTPNVQLYGGLVGYEPDLTKLFKQTNVPQGSLGLFFAGGGGVASLPAGSNLTWMGGGGVKWRATKALSWNLGEVYFTRVGNQNVPVVSTNLSFLFSKR